MRHDALRPRHAGWVAARQTSLISWINPVLSPTCSSSTALMELARQRRMGEQLLQDPALEILDLDVRRTPLQRSRTTRAALRSNAIERFEVVERRARRLGQFAQQLQPQRTRRHRQQQRFGLGDDRRPVLG